MWITSASGCTCVSDLLMYIHRVRLWNSVLEGVSLVLFPAGTPHLFIWDRNFGNPLAGDCPNDFVPRQRSARRDEIGNREHRAPEVGPLEQRRRRLDSSGDQLRAALGSGACVVAGGHRIAAIAPALLAVEYL